MAKNTIQITRRIGGHTIKARAEYLEDADLWECVLLNGTRSRDVSDNAYQCLADLIDEEWKSLIDAARKEHNAA